MEGVTIPLAMMAGVVAFLSPCFLPIVPVFLTYLVGGTGVAAGVGADVGTTGAAVGTTVAAAGTTRLHGPRVAAHALAFIGGFTVVFVGLWASIGLVGYLLGDHQNLLRIGGGAVLVVLGLHVAGLIDIPALHRRVGPAGPVGGARGGAGEAAPSFGRSTLMGLAFGAGWTPCIGPILGGVIGLATTTSTVGQGSLLLVAFSLGLGIPLLVSALGFSRLAGGTSWLMRHQRALSLLNGAVLLTIGFLMISDQFGRLAGLIPAFGI